MMILIRKFFGALASHLSMIQRFLEVDSNTLVISVSPNVHVKQVIADVQWLGGGYGIQLNRKGRRALHG
jgi:hypothetical protein